jgi:hypothetical protein
MDMSSGTIEKDPPPAVRISVASAAPLHAHDQSQHPTSETEIMYIASDDSVSSEEASRESDDNGEDIFYGTS